MSSVELKPAPTPSWENFGAGVRHVAIIGAGASGIVAAKTLLQAGLEVTIFEAGSYLGGLWKYDNDNGASIAYRNLTILTPKRYTEWRDFPFDADTPEYAQHKDMLRYFHQYADFFGITPRIRFNDRVVKVKPTGAKWEITSQVGGVQQFDAVVVATGHFHDPRLPNLPGRFTGELMHSAQYREPSQAANKQVLVIGLGNSACDIAVDVSWVASKTFISARTPVFGGPRWMFGHSFLDILRRFQGVWMPKTLPGRLAKHLVRIHSGDMSRWGFREPRKGAHGVLNEYLLALMKAGRIKLRYDIVKVDGRQVTFDDGTTEEFDLIIAATGYAYGFPFLDGLVELVNESAEVKDVYLRIFAIDQPGMCFVGLSNNNGVANTPTFERQAEVVADVLTHRVALPPADEMREAARLRRIKTQELYLNTLRHAMEERHPDYAMELQRERINRRTRSNGGEPKSKLAKSYGSLCWLCGAKVASDHEHILHATDWGSLRWWPNIYTKPVKLCPSCFSETRRTDLAITVTAAAVGIVALLAVGGVGILLVGVIRHFL